MPECLVLTVRKPDRLNDLPGGATYDVAWAYGYNPADQVVTQTQSNDLYAFTGRSAAI